MDVHKCNMSYMSKLTILLCAGTAFRLQEDTRSLTAFQLKWENIKKIKFKKTKLYSK